jgi:hypothetical protein
MPLNRKKHPRNPPDTQPQVRQDLIIVSMPEGAMKEDDITEMKKEFTSLGVNLIVVEYHNNACLSPRFERFRLGD